TIVAPGNYASPIDVTVAGDAHGAVSVTPSQISGPQPKSTTSIAVHYDASKPLTDATIMASAAGATPGTAHLTPLIYAVSSSAPIVVGGSTRTLTVSMAGYDGAFTATASGTQVSVACSSTTCKPSAPGGSVTFVITGRSPGEATVVVSGGGTHATIPVQVIAPPLFAYTGAAQTFTVPSGVTHLRVDAFGAAGGNGQNGARGGLGGETLATLSVSPGARITLFVGGAGGAARSCQGGAGGFNGGAGGGHRGEHHHWFCFPSTGGGGGGGASDVRAVAGNATDRSVVAGGGGGGSGFGRHSGGNGGELTGEAGQGDLVCSGGGGGTQTAGGKPGRCIPACFDRGTSGGFSAGGAGGDGTGPLIPGGGGGAGGGGYYGGGGACGTTIVHAGGGGGGSSFAKAGSTDVTMRRGVRAGDGQIVLTW
ncbi:MAG: hypothetical protein JOY98_12420, partial [Candidatus Eremiobacteraeota bacterium]|nr:hypothetical protein [Candidatus Eremiobacteraeota bacterium]